MSVLSRTRAQAHCPDHATHRGDCFECGHAELWRIEHASLRKQKKTVSIDPSHYTPQLSRARSRLQKALVKCFKAQRQEAQAAARRRLILKIAKADDDLPDIDPDELADDIYDELADEFLDVMPEAREALEDAGESGVRKGALDLDIDDTGLIASANQGAADYASNRAAEMVGKKYDLDGSLIDNPDAKWAISNTTRDQLRSLITGAFEKETPIDDLIGQIGDLGVFSDTRAELIARTEISQAQVNSNAKVWKDSGMVDKVKWLCSAEGPCEVCSDNCDEVVNFGDPFPSGDTEPLAHPACRCILVAVFGDEAEGDEDEDDDEGDEIAEKVFRRPVSKAAGSPEGKLAALPAIRHHGKMRPDMAGTADLFDGVERCDYKNALAAEYKRGGSRAPLEEALSRAEVRPFDPREATASQTWLKRQRVREYLKGRQESGGISQDVPWIVHEDGKDKVVDGHHRLAAAILQGKPAIFVRYTEHPEADADLISMGKVWSFADQDAELGELIKQGDPYHDDDRSESGMPRQQPFGHDTEPMLPCVVLRADDTGPGVPGFAAVDTGAVWSGIDARVMEKLAIEPVACRLIYGLSSPKPAVSLVFPARIIFPGSNLPDLALSDFGSLYLSPNDYAGLKKADDGRHPVVALIGRAALTKLTMIYDGATGSVRFTERQRAIKDAELGQLLKI